MLNLERSLLITPDNFQLSVIPDEQAPAKIREKYSREFSYNAILKKRVGKINGQDFLNNAKRMVSLCDQVYHGTKPEMIINANIAVGPLENAIVSFTHIPLVGTPIDLFALDEADIDGFFRKSSSVVLNLKPTEDREDLKPSFAQIEWTKRVPNKISFYAQDAHSKNDLKNLLYAKLFHIPGAPPSLNYQVKLGILETIDEI